MATTTHRIHNFSAGPAVLPVPVLEEAQRNLVALPGVGMSVLEISHRSKTFEDILAKTEADIRALGNVPSNYKVLFLQGGASLQFSMVPLNLLTAGATADYIVTGGWAQKAVKEAQRVGTVHIAASTESENFARIPRQDELKLTAERRLRAHDDQQHALRHRVAERAEGGRGAARGRHLVRHVQPADRRVEVRLDLRRRAEEPGSFRRDARDHPRGSAGALEQVAPHDAELRRSRRERIDVQHAALLRHLPDGAGHEVGAGRRAASRRSASTTSARRRRSTQRSTAPVSTEAQPRRRAARG